MTSSYNGGSFFGPTSPSSPYLLPPTSHYGSFFGQTVIPASATDDSPDGKSLTYSGDSYHQQSTAGQDMDVECGRSLTQLDSVASTGDTSGTTTSLLDLSDSLLLHYDSSAVAAGGSTTVLPPVSTFLMSSLYRESSW